MARLGYEQTAEHKAKRIRTGPEHANWKGNDITVKSGRSRALRKFPPQPCTVCGCARSDRHHVDGDTSNNDESNVLFLCRRCHMTADGRIDRLVATAALHVRERVTAAAVAKRNQTHCKRGHLLSGVNLYTYRGKRHCKQCVKIHATNYNKRKAS